MKNYYSSNTPSRSFIESYKVAGEEIVLHLGTGETYKVPYSKENLDLIEEKMRTQALKAKKNKAKIQATIDESRYFKKLFLVISGMAIFILIKFPMLDIQICGVMLLACGILGEVLSKKAETKYTAILSDMEKHSIYVSIEDELNKQIKASNPNISLGVSKRAADLIELRTDKGFDFMVVDKLSLEDLITLRDNLLRSQELGFDEPGVTSAPIKIMRLLPKDENSK